MGGGVEPGPWEQVTPRQRPKSAEHSDDEILPDDIDGSGERTRRSSTARTESAGIEKDPRREGPRTKKGLNTNRRAGEDAKREVPARNPAGMEAPARRERERKSKPDGRGDPTGAKGMPA